MQLKKKGFCVQLQQKVFVCFKRSYFLHIEGFQNLVKKRVNDLINLYLKRRRPRWVPSS